jgi:hypothetical protein
MKPKYIWTFCSLFWLAVGVSAQENIDSDRWLSQADKLLQEAVVGSLVDYKALQDQAEVLERLVEVYPQTEAGSAERKAVWINLYNLAVLHQVLQHYPIESPQAVPDFFSESFIPFDGERVSLNHLEKQLLFPQFPDARLHFVLVCAAKSCPPLMEGAFFPEQLDRQIGQQTRQAMDDGSFLRVNSTANRVELSAIFDWYEKDFTAESESVVAWINAHRSKDLPGGMDISYYTYDWSLNEVERSAAVAQPRSIIQEYTPSRLLPKGSWEAKVFNNLYTETKGADEDGNRSDRPRATFLTNIVEGFVGVSPNARVNVGLIVTVRSSLISGPDTEQPALEALRYGNDEQFARSGLAYIAPSVRFTPFKRIPRLSFQSSLQLPMFDEESVNGVFFAERSTIIANKVYYDHSFGNGDWQLFSEVAFDYLFGPSEESYANNSGFLPVSVFLSYFPSSKLTFYANAQHARRIDLGNNFSQDFTLVGLGAKYQLTDGLNIEISHAQFIAGHSSGLGATYNLGFRYVNL